jgi:hypothetical protein
MEFEQTNSVDIRANRGELIKLGEQWSKNQLSRLDKGDQKLMKKAFENLSNPKSQKLLTKTEYNNLMDLLKKPRTKATEGRFTITKIFKNIHPFWSNESQIHSKINTAKEVHRKLESDKFYEGHDSDAVKFLKKYFKDNHFTSEEKATIIEFVNPLLHIKLKDELRSVILLGFAKRNFMKASPDDRAQLMEYTKVRMGVTVDIFRIFDIESHFCSQTPEVRYNIMSCYNNLVTEKMNPENKSSLLKSITLLFKDKDENTRSAVLNFALKMLDPDVSELGTCVSCLHVIPKRVLDELNDDDIKLVFRDLKKDGLKAPFLIKIFKGECERLGQIPEGQEKEAIEYIRQQGDSAYLNLYNMGLKNQTETIKAINERLHVFTNILKDNAPYLTQTERIKFIDYIAKCQDGVLKDNEVQNILYKIPLVKNKEKFFANAPIDTKDNFMAYWAKTEKASKVFPLK